MSFEALIEAVQSDNERMVDLIIKNGVNVDLSDSSGKSALHYAAFKGIFSNQKSTEAMKLQIYSLICSRRWKDCWFIN